MVVSLIPTQCVNQCLLDCIRAGRTILKSRDSQLAKTNLAPLGTWLSFFQRRRTDYRIESNEIHCFSVDGICYHYNTVFEAKRCYYHYFPCQEARPSLTDTDIERGINKRQQDRMRWDYIQKKGQKGYQIFEMWESL